MIETWKHTISGLLDVRMSTRIGILQDTTKKIMQTSKDENDENECMQFRRSSLVSAWSGLWWIKLGHLFVFVCFPTLQKHLKEFQHTHMQVFCMIWHQTHCPLHICSPPTCSLAWYNSNNHTQLELHSQVPYSVIRGHRRYWRWLAASGLRWCQRFYQPPRLKMITSPRGVQKHTSHF